MSSALLAVISDACGDYVQCILTAVCVISLTSSLHIDKRNLLPPLLVIQTLAHNSTATLAVVKVRHPTVLPSLCILYLSVASLVE